MGPDTNSYQERARAMLGQAAGWSWWRACSASSMTPTWSRCGGSARRVATSRPGVSTGTPSKYSSPQGRWVSCTHSIGMTGAPSAWASWWASQRTVASAPSSGWPLCHAEPSGARVMRPCQALESTRNTPGGPTNRWSPLARLGGWRRRAGPSSRPAAAGAAGGRYAAPPGAAAPRGRLAGDPEAQQPAHQAGGHRSGRASRPGAGAIGKGAGQRAGGDHGGQPPRQRAEEAGPFGGPVALVVGQRGGAGGAVGAAPLVARDRGQPWDGRLGELVEGADGNADRWVVMVVWPVGG